MGALPSSVVEQRPGEELLNEELRLHERVAAGDQGALLEWVHRIGGEIYCIALSRTRHDGAAEDLTEALFLDVWRHPERFHPAKGPLVLQLVRQMNLVTTSP